MPPELTDEDKQILQANGVPLTARAPQATGGLTDEEKSILAQNGVPIDDKQIASTPAETPWFQFKGSPNGGLLNDLKAKFSNPDSEAKATMESFSLPGGLTSDAIMEALKRLGSRGKEGLGSEEWKNAAQGRSAGIPAQLQSKFGMSPTMSYVLGLPAGAVTDPLAGFIGGVGSVEKPQWNNLWQMLSQRNANGAPNIQPIGQALEGTGKAAYSAPFKRADAEIVSKYKNGVNLGKKPLSNLLWNEGNPEVGGFTQSNPEIGQAVVQARKDAGTAMSDILKRAGGEDIDLAPTLADAATVGQLKDATAAGEQLGEGSPSWKDWLKSQIASEDKTKRQQAIQLLADSAPDLASVINKNAGKLANSNDKSGVVDFYHGLIDDLAEGPRSLEGLQSLKTSYANQAAGNIPMGQNAFTHGGLKINQGKMADMAASGDLSDVIDNTIDKRLGASGWDDAKKSYSILRRGEMPVLKTTEAAAKRPLLSKLDMLVGGLGIGSAPHDPHLLAAAAGAKVLNEISKNPRWGTGTGMLFNNVGKSNLWDNMMRRQLMNSALNGGQQQ